MCDHSRPRPLLEKLLQAQPLTQYCHEHAIVPLYFEGVEHRAQAKSVAQHYRQARSVRGLEWQAITSARFLLT